MTAAFQHFTAHEDCKIVEKGQKRGLKWQKWGVGEGLIYIRPKGSGCSELTMAVVNTYLTICKEYQNKCKI